VKTQQTKNSTSMLKTILIVVIIVTTGFFYWMNTKDSLDETYKIKSAGGESGYKASFINTSGKESEEKKIKLSDGFWTGGKFGF